MKARHRLTRRHQHDGRQGIKKTAEFAIDSDTFMFVHTPGVNYDDEKLLFLGSGGDFTGGARPVFKADLSDANKWGINTNDTILSATLTVFADSIEGSAGVNDGDVDVPVVPTDPLVSVTFPGIAAKLLTIDLTTWNEIVHGAGAAPERAVPVSYAPYPVVVYSHRPPSPNHPATDRLNWNEYAGGQQWSTPGAENTTDDINVDIGYTEFELRVGENIPDLPSDDATYEIDVTEHAKYAVSSRGSEFCVQMYRGSDDTGNNNENLTKLYSVSHSLASRRPKLLITYLDRS